MENNDYMKLALLEAKKAYKLGEVPVGAVIVYNGEVIAKGHNTRETKQSVTSHAELEAIKKAEKVIGSWRLEDCIMYVTLEPCSMCAGAIIQSRIKEVYFGAYDMKAGACGSILDLFSFKFNHEVYCRGGIMEHECLTIIQDFFKELRNNKY